MKKFCDKVLDKIKEEKITPKPRWHFLLKDCFVWMCFFAAVIVGGLAFCVMLHVFSTNDWDIYVNLQRSWMAHFLISLPYIWMVGLILFVGLACYNYRHTKRGYRTETFWVVLLSVIGSLILGTLIHFTNLGERIENALFEKVPISEEMSCCGHRKDVWSQPEKGLLGGRVLKIISAGIFDLEDFSGALWEVEKNEKTIIREPAVILEGEEIKIIGKIREGKIFKAVDIRPWQYLK